MARQWIGEDDLALTDGSVIAFDGHSQTFIRLALADPLGDEQLTLRLDESVSAPKAGQWFEATPRADRLHQFDAASGQRLDH